MAMLLNVAITTAVSQQVGSTFQIKGGQQGPIGAIACQANFTYGSGGTTCKTWLQASLDGGVSWWDAIAFSFTTANAVSIGVAAPTGFTAAAAAFGAESAGVVSGVWGSWWRVGFTTTGTYAGGTTLRVDVSGLNVVPAGVGA